MKKIATLLAALLVLALAPFPIAGAPSSELGLHVKPCTQGHSKVSALCGTFGVYEDRAARSGQIIQLQLVVLKAKHPTHRAIAEIAGGPGESSVGFAPYIADNLFEKPLSSLRENYDILFVDNRGMGGSNPSKCDFAPLADPASYFRQLWPDNLVAACRKKYSETSNLSLYNTNNAVDDLSDVRTALGYPKLVLDSGSYGTFFSLIYVRRHSESIESAILDGVAPPHFQPIPGAPDGAQTALDDLIVKCRHDAVCNTHFPKFAQQFDALMQRLDRGPVPVSVKNPKNKRFETVLLSKEVFVDRLRQALYDPEGVATVPYVVERLSQGDSVPLGRLMEIVTQGLAQDLDEGAYLSYSCAEFVPFISEDELKAAAAHSFAGDLRVRAQQRACKIWNVQAMPPSFNDPVRSDVPVLMVSGSDDPATPPRSAAEELPYLSNGKIVLVQGAGHAIETPCTDRLMELFVRAGSAKALNVSRCNAAFTPPHFDTSMKGWPEI
jgi:pimeloyl-ACP methyl ester carboxylesterase